MRPDTFVYFLASVDRSMVKIGCSYLPAKRLAALQTWSPLKLELIASAPGSLEDERAIHSHFLAHHSHGEWFKGDPDIFLLAKTVAETGSIPDHLRGEFGQKNPLLKKGNFKKRTPEQCKRIRDGVLAAHARQRAAFEAACQRYAARHQEPAIPSQETGAA